MSNTSAADEVKFVMCSGWTGSLFHASELKEAAEVVRGNESEGIVVNITLILYSA